MKRIKNKKIFALIAVLLSLCAVFIGSITYALFSANSNIDAGFGSGEVNYAISNVQSLGDGTLSEPGETYTKSFNLKNTGDTPFRYTIKLNVTREESLREGQIGIENAIFVYIDDNYYGLLANVMDNEYEVALPLAPNDSTSHTVEFQYHIDGYTNYNNKIHLDADVGALLALNNDSDYVFIDTFNQLLQHSRKNDVKGRTLIFTNDITLTKDIAFKTDVNINLNSHTVHLNGYKFSLEGENITSVITIDNREDLNPDRLIKGYFSTDEKSNSALVINTPNGLVLDKTGFEGTTLGNIPSTSYNAELLLTEATKEIETALKNGIDTTTSFLEGYAPYYQADVNGRQALTLATSDDTNLVINYSLNNVELIPTRFEYTQDYKINVTARDYNVNEISFRVWGNNDEAIIDRYLESELQFLANYSEAQNAYVINADIFLPLQIQQLGAKIRWLSSNEEVISTTGKFSRPYSKSETNVELTAYIVYNNVARVQSYPLYIEKKNADDILKEIIYELESKLTFAYVFESKDNADNVRELVIASDYADHGVTALEYLDLDPEYEGIFALDKNAPSLELLVDTTLSSAELGLTITVTDGDEVTNATGYARIKIEINRSDNVFDAMYNNFLGYISHIDQNTLESFEVPSIYLQEVNTYNYYILPGTNNVPGSGETVSYTNPDDCNNYITVSEDNKEIKINPYSLPNENTDITILIEMITNVGQASEQSNYRTCKIQLTGVLLQGRDIEDANLFYQLRKLIDRDPINGNNDGFISRDEVEAVNPTELTYRNSHVESVKGLEFFTSLETIDLSGNQITDLSPLATLYNLTSLDLDDNRIINIGNLGNLTNLETLSLSGNEIVDISDLRYLTSLTTLNINDNVGIIDLGPIIEMTNLATLRVYNTAAVDGTNLRFNLNYLITQHEVITYNRANFYVNNNSTRWHPTTAQINANEIINYIEPIEEFGQVIVLPTEITYEGTTYTIYWENTDSSRGIITIDQENGRAYVKQPIADKEITLHAYIEYGSESIYMYKVMDVLSRKGNEVIKLIQSDGTVLEGDEVVAAIPDPALRQFLFDKYGSDNVIDIPAIMATADGTIDLSGSKVTDLTGLEYFKDIVTSFTINNVFIEDYSVVADLVNLQSFIANSGNLDVSVFSHLTNLSYLYIYGCNYVDYSTGLAYDDYTLKGNLYQTYIANSDNAIRIFFDAATEWNPFIEPMNDVLTTLQSIYPVQVGISATLPDVLNLDMYGIEIIPIALSSDTVKGAYAFNFSYALASGSGVSLSRNVVTLNRNNVTAVDTFVVLNVTINMKNADTSVNILSSTRKVLIEKCTIGEMMLECIDGEYRRLDEVVLNPGFRGSIITLWTGATIDIDGVSYPYVSHGQIMNMTTIAINGFDGGDLSGIEQFYGSTRLSTISIQRFSRSGFGSVDYNLGDYINNTNFPALRTLNIDTSFVEIEDFMDLPLLTTLNVYNCIYVSLSAEAFGKMTSLRTLNLNGNGIVDFTGIEALQNISTLNIYSNLAVTNATLYEKTNELVMQVYTNYKANGGGDYIYHVTSSTALWSPVDVSNLNDLDDVYVTTSDGTLKEVGYPGYDKSSSNIYTDQIDEITYLNNGDIIYLPIQYMGVPIAWESSTDYVLEFNANNIVTYNGQQCYRIVVKALPVKAYSILYAKIETRRLCYAFIVEEDGSIASHDYDEHGYVRFVATEAMTAGLKALNGSYVIDYNTFYEGDKLADVTFFTAVLDRIVGFRERYKNDGTYFNYYRKNNWTGLFTAEQTKEMFFSSNGQNGSSSTEIRFAAGSESVSTNIKIENIKGIKNFYYCETLHIEDQPITNIEELKYLTNVSYFMLTGSYATSLYDSEGYSIFKDMNNLDTIRIDGSYFEDYAPIVYNRYYTDQDGNLIAEERPQEAISKIKTLYIFPYSNYMYTPEQNVHVMLNKYYEYKSQYGSNSISLRINNDSAFSTINGFEAFVKSVNELMMLDLSNETYDLNSTLPSSLSDGTTIYWTTVAYSLGNSSADIGFAIDSSGRITTLTYNTDGIVTVAAYVGASSSSRYATRRIDINLSSAARPDATLVEISSDEYINLTTGNDFERSYYESSQIISNSDGYFVAADAAIPDPNLQRTLYSFFDINNDGVMSISERNSTTYSSQDMNVYYRNICSIKGLELFPYVRGWNLYGNSIKKIDALLFPTNHALINLNLGLASNPYSGNRDLSDISNIIFDADGSGTKYKAISYTLERLDLTSAIKLGIHQTVYLTNTNPNNFPSFQLNYSALTYLNPDRTKLSTDGRYIPYLPQTITNFTYFINSTYNGWDQRGSRRAMDNYILNSVYSTNSNKRLTTTTLAANIEFSDVYPIGEATALPKETTIYGKTYKLGYERVWSNRSYYTITNDTSTDTWYITPTSSAPAEVSIVAYVKYENLASGGTLDRGYQENVTINTSGAAGETAQVTYVSSEGDIQLTSGGPFEDLRTYLDDPAVRYYMFRNFDTNRNNQISYTELSTTITTGTTFAFGDANRSPESLNGIEILAPFNLTSIRINYSYMYDYTPLKNLQKLTSITIANARYPMYYTRCDLEFLNELPLLTDLSLDYTNYLDMNFLFNNTTLKTIRLITRTSSVAIDAQYIRTAWAYARANGSLTEDESTMNNGVSNSNYISTEKDKEAAYVLNEMSFVLGSQLPTSVSYAGKLYGAVEGAVTNTKFTWVSVSAGIDIDQETNIATSNGKRTNGGVLCIFYYQGRCYERLFVVDC